MGWVKRLGYYVECPSCKQGYVVPWDWSEEDEAECSVHVCGEKSMYIERMLGLKPHDPNEDK